MQALVLNVITSLVLNTILITTRAQFPLRPRQPLSNDSSHVLFGDYYVIWSLMQVGNVILTFDVIDINFIVLN